MPATTTSTSPLTPGIVPPGGGSASVSTSTSTPILPTGPYPDRELPSWLPASADSLNSELQDQYGLVNKMFSTGAVDKAAANQQAEDLSMGMRAANSAATEYTQRTTQQGGSAAGAGLIRAEGQVGALNAAGAAKVEAAKYDVEQREKAATQSAQIATTLAGLRGDYLKTLSGYAASEDATATGTSASSASAQSAADGSGSGGGAGGNGTWAGEMPTPFGRSLGIEPVQYNQQTGQVAQPIQQGSGVDWITHAYGGG